MKRRIVALGVALFVFAGSAMASLAADASRCPHPNSGGVHSYIDDKIVGGRIDNLGYHAYVCGYDENGKAIIHNDCKMTQTFEYHIIVCRHCGGEKPNSAYTKPLPVQHSIIHK